MGQIKSFCFNLCENQITFDQENMALSEQRKTIVFAGPQKSGKSSIIYFLKNKRTKRDYEQTKAIQETNLKFQGKHYDLKEVTDQLLKIKSDGFVYVYDSQAAQNYEYLNLFLSNIDSRVPVLLFLNKNDLVKTCVDESKINFGKSRKYKIITSDKSGEHVFEGFQWLISSVESNSTQMKQILQQINVSLLIIRRIFQINFLVQKNEILKLQNLRYIPSKILAIFIQDNYCKTI